MTPREDLRCLCVNAGSSSLKMGIYSIGVEGAAIRQGEAEAYEIGQADAGIRINGKQKKYLLKDHHAAFETLVDSWSPAHVDAIGHRVVHGGDHTGPEQITPSLMQRLNKLIPLAPLHNPPAMMGIRSAMERYPHIPQIACFDTAFHATLPEEARTLPLPRRYREQGVRRYGFHGLSYEYVTRQLGPRNQGRLVIAHLGNGASLSAIRNGRCIDTTMGLTPTGGIMMGTRSGDIDPGVLLYLGRTEHLDMAALEYLLNHESGLLGVSGISSNMAQLLSDSSPTSRLAVNLFAYQVRKGIGAMAASLGGLERLVFTGGIGEHAAAVRWMICRDLEYLGIVLNTIANDANADVISSADSSCPVEVIATDEDAMIARHVFETLVENHEP